MLSQMFRRWVQPPGASTSYRRSRCSSCGCRNLLHTEHTGEPNMPSGNRSCSWTQINTAFSSNTGMSLVYNGEVWERNYLFFVGHFKFCLPKFAGYLLNFPSTQKNLSWPAAILGDSGELTPRNSSVWNVEQKSCSMWRPKPLLLQLLLTSIVSRTGSR